MRRASLVAGIVFFAFSTILAIVSWSMEYYSSIGPGPGFFPFWLSLILGLLSVVWIFQVLKTPDPASATKYESKLLPGSEGLRRLVSIVGALVFMIILMEPIGFQLPMFAFLVFLLIVMGKIRLWITLCIAAVGSFGLFRVFTILLDVQLPQSAIPFLAAIGL